MADGLKRLWKDTPWIQFILALVMTAGFFSTLAFAMTQGIPVANRDIVMLLVGEMVTVWAATVGFFVWTTASSARKTEMLAQSPAIKME